MAWRRGLRLLRGAVSQSGDCTRGRGAPAAAAPRGDDAAATTIMRPSSSFDMKEKVKAQPVHTLLFTLAQSSSRLNYSTHKTRASPSPPPTAPNSLQPSSTSPSGNAATTGPPAWPCFPLSAHATASPPP